MKVCTDLSILLILNYMTFPKPEFRDEVRWLDRPNTSAGGAQTWEALGLGLVQESNYAG